MCWAQVLAPKFLVTACGQVETGGGIWGGKVRAGGGDLGGKWAVSWWEQLSFLGWFSRELDLKLQDEDIQDVGPSCGSHVLDKLFPS